MTGIDWSMTLDEVTFALIPMAIFTVVLYLLLRFIKCSGSE
jgi:hypothetical protein